MFSYRYNTRKWKDDARFDDTFEMAKGRLPYKILTANSKLEFLS